MDAVTDKDAPNRFGHDRSPGVASGEKPGGVADSVGGWAVAVHVVKRSGRRPEGVRWGPCRRWR